jgi:hypothetical protein
MSCSDDGTSSSTTDACTITSTNAIVGNWTDRTGTLSFFDDHTMSFFDPDGMSQRGTWSIDNGVLVTFSSDPNVVRYVKRPVVVTEELFFDRALRRSPPNEFITADQTLWSGWSSDPEHNFSTYITLGAGPRAELKESVGGFRGTSQTTTLGTWTQTESGFDLQFDYSAPRHYEVVCDVASQNPHFRIE